MRANRVTLVSLLATPSVAYRINAQAAVQASKAEGHCRITGPDGMQLSYSTKNCMKSCGPSIDVEGRGTNQWTYERKFADAFTVGFDDASGKCTCSAGGKMLAVFKPLKSTQEDACKAGTSFEVHDECLEGYKRARGTRYREFGGMVTPRYEVPFSSKDFTVHRDCTTTCTPTIDGHLCDLEMPGPLDGMDPNKIKDLGDAIHQCQTEDKCDGAVKKLTEILPPADIQNALWTAGHTPEPTPVPTPRPTPEPPMAVDRLGDDDVEDLDEDMIISEHGDEDAIRDAIRGGRMLSPGAITNSWCALLTVGARGCEESGANACKCKFIGAKGVGCSNIFNLGPKQVKTVYKNTKVALFMNSGCSCTHTDLDTIPVESECVLKVGEIQRTAETPAKME